MLTSHSGSFLGIVLPSQQGLKTMDGLSGEALRGCSFETC
jgi:hypothetical protein